MKKAFALLFTSLMVLSLAACAPTEPAPAVSEEIPVVSAESEPGFDTEPAAPASDITIGVCFNRLNSTYEPEAARLASFKNSMETQAKALGAKLEIVDSQYDQWTQNGQIYDFIAEGVSALILSIVNPSDAGEIAEQAAAAGIPVVFFYYEPYWEGYSNAWYVGAHAEEPGAAAGKIISDYFKAHPEADKNNDEKIQYVMLQGEPGHADAALPAEYLIKGITDEGTFGVENLGSDTAMWDKVKATDLMKNFIASQGLDKIEAVLACNDDMALGALDALKEEGYNTGDTSKYIPVVGADATADALESISRGELLGTVLNDYENQGWAAVNAAVAAVQWPEVNEDAIGYEITDGKYIWIPYVKVTADNYMDFM